MYLQNSNGCYGILHSGILQKGHGDGPTVILKADEAALEVSFSRLYGGGIHYRQSVKDAYDQGKKIGNLVMAKLESR